MKNVYMIAEKGHFHFAEKHWGDQGPPAPPVPTALSIQWIS